MFSEGAGWNRPIYFRGGVGGHADVCQVGREAERKKVLRLVFCHLGRPTIRAIEHGLQPPFGEIGIEGAVYKLEGLMHASA